MEHTSIATIKEKVSRIGLGTWAVGGSLWGGTNEEESVKTIHRALQMGINLIDTAPGYGKGTSEKIIGKALKEYGKRDKVIIATKFGLNLETDSVFRDSRRDSILKEIDASLQRLQVDFIDLYQVHWPDPATPLRETAETLDELLQQGIIKAIGVCNFTVEQMIEFQKYSPIHSSQPPFNMFERAAQKGLINYCVKEGIALMGYSALCRGLLSGKMSKDREFKGDDLRKGMDPKFKGPLFEEYLQAAEALKAWVKKKYNRPLIALAIRWVLDSGVNIALWGARKPEQLRDVEEIFGWKLSAADFAEIDNIIKAHVKHPVEPEFMAPPVRSV